jgi:hypothetical protein
VLSFDLEKYLDFEEWRGSRSHVSQNIEWQYQQMQKVTYHYGSITAENEKAIAAYDGECRLIEELNGNLDLCLSGLDEQLSSY